MGDKKVLIIDDERLIRLTTRILLEKRGFSVVEAMNGVSGIECAIKKEPVLILLDIMMPGMNGWEVFEELQKLDATKKIPVVIFTAGDFVNSEKIAKQKGVKWIIRKPFNIDSLLELFSEIERS